MDYKRLTLAAVVAWVVDAAYGFMVWGRMLRDDMARNPAVFRSEAEITGYMPLMFAGILLAMFALAYIYAKGYEGGSGIAEGARFGALIGLFTLGMVSIGIFATFNIGSDLAVKASIGSFIEMVLIGTTIGAVYRPAAVARRVGARV